MIIGICDDEIWCVKELDKLISKYFFKNNVDITVKSYMCLSELAAEVNSLDIIFLDIRFNHETLGMEWAKELRKQGNSNLIVFCSSLNDMVIHGYEAEAFRFIVKPVVEVELFKILDACIDKLKTTSNQISVVSNFGNTLINISKIIYICSKQRVYHIYLKDNTVVTTYENLKAIYERINRHYQFKYPHKSYIVNLAEVMHLEATTLYMSNGTQIPVSRNVAPQLKKDIIAFMGGKR